MSAENGAAKPAQTFTYKPGDRLGEGTDQNGVFVTDRRVPFPASNAAIPVPAIAGLLANDGVMRALRPPKRKRTTSLLTKWSKI